MDFALNQKTASNDLAQPFFNGIAPARADEMRERGLRLLGLSEIYPFNGWNEERRAAVAALVATTDAAGAETVNLTPRVDFRDPDSVAPTVSLGGVLTEIAPMLEGTRVVALFEPIDCLRRELGTV
jgi:2-keto-myo-inositol isomerase